MRIVYLEPDSPHIIGQQGENNAVTLRVDVTQWAADFPNGTGVILFTRPNKVVYPLETGTIELDGKTYLQTIITTKENNVPGWVVLQAQWYNGETLVKSMMFSGKVLVSGDTPVDTTETVPDWVTEWMETFREAVDGASELIEAAETMNEDLEASKQAASDSEAWAKGTRDGEAVESTDDTYHNNSKYYSEQIAATAEDVEAWANGTRGGVDIDSTDPAYHKNGKYYNTQAAASAAAAAASASEAMTDTPEGYSNVVASIAPTYDGTATYAVGDYCLNGGKLYRCTTAIEEAEATFNSAHWTQVNVGGEVSDVGSEVSDLKSAVDSVETIFKEKSFDVTPSASTSGYISPNGTQTESQSCNYKTITVTSAMKNRTFAVSGSKWYYVSPYIFVGASGTISEPDVPWTTSPTQYTDLEFVPTETGTLYINIYGSHIGKAEYTGVDTDHIKSDVLPVDDIADEMIYASDYTVVDIGEMILQKLLNGETGEITDGNNDIQRVSDYIAVTPGTEYLISTHANYGRGLYAWYTSDKTFISGESAENVSSQTYIHGKHIKSPSNAAYIVIGYIHANSHPFSALMKGHMVPVGNKRWAGKKWTIIGDSLSQSYAPTGIHYFEMIAGVTGIECTNLSQSGTGYAKGDTGFRAQALNVPVDTDVVTLFGSGNDLSSGLEFGTASDTGTETIAGCINTTIDSLYSINPLMPIGIITPSPWKLNMPYNNGRMETYSNLIVDICRRRGIPCLDLFHCYGLDTNSDAVIAAAYSRDGGSATHPDERGQHVIACRVKAFLETLIL